MIALYSRVSTQEQAKEGYSIGEQQDRLKAYCDGRGWKGYKHFVDGGFSGAKLDRPALQEMIAGIHAGTIKKVIVYKLDRLSRSQKDTLEIIEDVFIPNNVDFISITENLDTGSAFGRASIGLLACFAQLERENIRERMVVGKEGRAKDGKWHGGSFAPIGYDYIDGELVINDYEALQIKECFKLFLHGKSMIDIAKCFIKKGYSLKFGKWNAQKISYTLKNPVYIGLIKHNGNIYKGLHKEIISKADFDAVQKILSDNYIPRKSTTDALLLGKIYCAHCGARYSHKSCANNKYHYYSCYSKNKSNKRMIIDPNCQNMNYICNELDKIILDEIRKLTVADIHATPQETPDNLLPLKKELAKVDKQRERLMDLYTLGDFTIEELQKKVIPLTEKRESLRKQINELIEPKRNINELKKTVENIPDIIDNGDFYEIKQLIDELINKIEIDNENIKIFWDFY